MGVTDQSREQDLNADMKWVISKGSGMIQLAELLPAEVLYSTSHNSPTGTLWRNHFAELAAFIFRVSGSRHVLEIGGGNGILNIAYQKHCAPESWTIVDPTSVKVLEGCTANYVKRYWDRQFAESGAASFDTLVHSHLMEHQYDVREFMECCSAALRPGQRMVFSLPDFKRWIKNKYSNALNFEHTYFISEDYLDILMPEYHFRIMEKFRYGDGHSLFYAVERVEDGVRCNAEKPDYRLLYEDNRRAFREYVDSFAELTKKMNRAQRHAEGEIYLFGAHIFSQLLISFGLDVSRVKCILDNDTLKQGRRLYGTDLQVFSPRILAGKRRPMVLLNAGAYAEEIKADILGNINADAIIVE